MTKEHEQAYMQAFGAAVLADDYREQEAELSQEFSQFGARGHNFNYYWSMGYRDALTRNAARHARVDYYPSEAWKLKMRAHHSATPWKSGSWQNKAYKEGWDDAGTQRSWSPGKPGGHPDDPKFGGFGKDPYRINDKVRIEWVRGNPELRDYFQWWQAKQGNQGRSITVFVRGRRNKIDEVIQRRLFKVKVPKGVKKLQRKRGRKGLKSVFQRQAHSRFGGRDQDWYFRLGKKHGNAGTHQWYLNHPHSPGKDSWQAKAWYDGWMSVQPREPVDYTWDLERIGSDFKPIEAACYAPGGAPGCEFGGADKDAFFNMGKMAYQSVGKKPSKVRLGDLWNALQNSGLDEGSWQHDAFKHGFQYASAEALDDDDEMETIERIMSSSFGSQFGVSSTGRRILIGRRRALEDRYRRLQVNLRHATDRYHASPGPLALNGVRAVGNARNAVWKQIMKIQGELGNKGLPFVAPVANPWWNK